MSQGIIGRVETATAALLQLMERATREGAAPGTTPNNRLSDREMARFASKLKKAGYAEGARKFKEIAPFVKSEATAWEGNCYAPTVDTMRRVLGHTYRSIRDGDTNHSGTLSPDEIRGFTGLEVKLLNFADDFKPEEFGMPRRDRSSGSVTPPRGHMSF